MSKKIIAGLTLLIALSACGAAASEGSVAPNSGDVRRGNHWDALLRDGTPLYEDADVVARVSQVGQKVAASSGNPHHFEFRFFVLNSVEPTAFAAAGGYIYVTTGLLRALDNEDELAAILAHEIGHVNERHPMKTGMSQQARTFWTTMLALGSMAAAMYVQTTVASALAPYMTMENAEALQKLSELTYMVSNIGTTAVGQRVIISFYQGYRDEFEFKADELALQYAGKAGYRRDALAQVFERIGSHQGDISPLAVSHLHSPKKVLDSRKALVQRAVAASGRPR